MRSLPGVAAEKALGALAGGLLAAALLGWSSGSPESRPAKPLAVAADSAAVLATPPASALRVTWLGHATVLIELEGKRILTDPVFSDRAADGRGRSPGQGAWARAQSRPMRSVDSMSRISSESALASASSRSTSSTSSETTEASYQL